MSKVFSISIPDQLDAEITSSFNEMKAAIGISTEDQLIRKIVLDWIKSRMLQKAQQAYVQSKVQELNGIS